MHVRNVLHAARWKYRMQKSPSAHHRTTLSDYIFAIKVRISNWKKLVKQQYLPHMSSQYGELRPTSSWYLLASLGHPSKFQRVSHLGSITARHSSSGRQLNFAVLNRGHHLYSAGQPSRWALAHIVFILWCSTFILIGECVHFYVKFSFSIPSQDFHLGNVSKMTYFVSSGT